MSAAIATAMVMAAGLGTRMRPLTDDRPKALVAVDGRALIDHMLDRLAAAGVTRAVVNVHHFADRLEAHLTARGGAPAVTVSDERSRLLETGGGLVKALPRLGSEPIIVANSDPIWHEDPGARSAMDTLKTAWASGDMDALFLLARCDRALGYHGRGDFVMDAEGRIERRGDRDAAPFVYAGVQILNPAIARSFPEEPFSLNMIWDTALVAGRAYGVVLHGEWMHVGDPAARDAAEARLRALDAAAVE